MGERKMQIHSQSQLSYVTYAASILFNTYRRLLCVEVPVNIWLMLRYVFSLYHSPHHHLTPGSHQYLDERHLALGHPG